MSNPTSTTTEATTSPANSTPMATTEVDRDTRPTLMFRTARARLARMLATASRRPRARAGARPDVTAWALTRASAAARYAGAADPTVPTRILGEVLLVIAFRVE